MTLPARKEGIVPGAANLRLPRFVGDRIARQAIQAERKLNCDSPEGRLICDEIVADEAIEAAIDRIAVRLTDAGAVGALANRRSLRVGVEPFDVFRRYMAVYAREQAHCHFSPALIANLERYWQAQTAGETKATTLRLLLFHPFARAIVRERIAVTDWAHLKMRERPRPHPGSRRFPREKGRGGNPAAFERDADRTSSSRPQPQPSALR